MVILERTFNAGDGSIQLEVRRPEPDGQDFRCTYRLRGPDLDREAYGMGVDAVQALLLTLSRAHIDLLAYRRDTGRPVQWLDMRDLGLPLPDNITAADFDASLD